MNVIKDVKITTYSHHLPLWFLIFTIWYGYASVNGCYENENFTFLELIYKFKNWFFLFLSFYLGNIIANKDNAKVNELPSFESKINTILKCLFIISSILSLSCILSKIYLQSFLSFLSHPLNTVFNKLFLELNISRFLPGMNVVDINAVTLFSLFSVILQIPYFIHKKLFSFITHTMIILPNIAMMFLSDFPILAFFTIGIGIFSLMLHHAFRRKWLFIPIVLISFLFIQTVVLKKDLPDYIKKFHMPSMSFMTFKSFDLNPPQHQQSIEFALSLWKDKPLIGIGVGGFLQKQDKNIQPIMELHNTPVLLLTEIGFIGVFLYAWFLFRARKMVALKLKKSPDNLFAQGMLMIFPAFMAASLFIEIFYQFYLWFFLGLVLVKNDYF